MLVHANMRKQLEMFTHWCINNLAADYFGLLYSGIDRSIHYVSVGLLQRLYPPESNRRTEIL